ncbi:TonB family protein [Shewanella sp. A3A]|nr:TonB family protein [Shewanella ferrihydritica]
MARFQQFIVGSVLVHSAMLGAYHLWPAAEMPTISVSKQHSVSLGLMTAMAGSTAQQAIVQQAVQPTAPAEQEPQPKTPERVQQPPKPTPQPPAKQVQQLAKVQENKPKPKEQPPEKTPAKPQTAIAQAATKAGDNGEQGSKQTVNKQQESGIANQAGGADLNQAYDLQVRQHLLSFKTTPKRMALRRAKGQVSLSFTIDRNGEVLQQMANVELGQSGFRHEALAMLRRAVPFPKPPQELDWQQRDYQLEINYQLQ